MKLDFRSVVVLAVPILLVLFIVGLVLNWSVNYAEFRIEQVAAAFGLAFLLLFALDVTNPKRGRPSLYHQVFTFVVMVVQVVVVRWPYVKRDMGHDAYYGRAPKSDGASGEDMITSQRSTFAFSAGGPAIAMLNWFKRAMSLFAGIVGSSQPRVARVTA